MENINIKEYIINNFKDDNIETLRKAIEESIKENDDVLLPGLGVFLTLIWKEVNDNIKNDMLNSLKKQIDNYNN